MRHSKLTSFCLAVLLLTFGAASARSQSFVMSTPRASQRATVSQRLGLTDIAISYHRPLINGRKVWDALVPYGQVWRAGANENTVIEFSDPVSVEGQALPKGAYGLHMIPAADSWTVIFSKNSTSWGSFAYDQKEDALRVTVKPQPSEMHEALTYDIDDVKPDSALVTLRWEKVAVPFRVSVSKEQTLQTIRNQLRSLPQYTWMGWDDAAQYCLDSKINPEECLRWADRSIQLEERPDNLMTKAKALTALGRNDEASTAKLKAFEKAGPLQLYGYARQLQSQKKQAEALELFRATYKRFPEHWIGHLAQARVLSAAGDFPNAVKEINASLTAGAPDAQKPALQSLLKRLEAEQDINQ